MTELVARNHNGIINSGPTSKVRPSSAFYTLQTQTDEAGTVGERGGVIPEPRTEPKADWLTFEATAYVALCDSGCTGITATGYDVRNTIYSPKGYRVIAVDPSVVPLGALVEVRLSSGETFKARASDTGGAIKGRRIDLLIGTVKEARAFGRQSVKVRILQ